MFLKIFSLPVSRYVFLIGFVINGLIVMFRGFPFMNSLFVAFIGGLVFCGVWAGIIVVLTFLLTDKELSYYFNIPFTGEEYSEEDEDALTMDELYNMNPENHDNIESNMAEGMNIVNSEEEFLPDVADSFKPVDESSLTDGELLLDDTARTRVSLNRPDQFELTVNGKTLKAHPKDGANAIKKVLNDD